MDDVPVIVQDKTFDSQGQLVFDQRGPSSTGFLGDTVMVNGTIGAYLDVPTTHVRLRLLNASTARIYKFGFADDRTFDVVGTDGGLLTAPVPLDRIQLSPGERAEIVVTMTPGETVELRNYFPDFGGRVAGNSRFGTGDYRVLELRAADTLRDSPAAPATLAQFSRTPESSADRTRTFTINAQIINRRPVDMGRIDEVVPLDATEVWVLRNRDPQPHNFHVHTVQFQVLDIDGTPPPPQLAGWKDTVYLPPGSAGADHRVLHRLHRPDVAVHVPLPPAVARGLGADGPVRRRGTRPDPRAPAGPVPAALRGPSGSPSRTRITLPEFGEG